MNKSLPPELSVYLRSLCKGSVPVRVQACGRFNYPSRLQLPVLYAIRRLLRMALHEAGKQQNGAIIISTLGGSAGSVFEVVWPRRPGGTLPRLYGLFLARREIKAHRDSLSIHSFSERPGEYAAQLWVGKPDNLPNDLMDYVLVI